MKSSSPDRSPLDLLAEEFVARIRNGEQPTLSEYTQKYPELENDIRDLFPTLIEMEQLKPNTDDVTGEHTAFTNSIPTRVGEFRIVRQVGRGGMGIVYEAIQESLGRHVALKLLPPEAMLDPRRLERFRREAKAAAKLHHTNIVPVFGSGEADGRYYYTMQFISGQPLDAVIDEVRRLKDKPAARSVSEVTSKLLAGNLGGLHHSAATNEGHTNVQSDSISTPLSESGRHYWETVCSIGSQAAEALAYAHAQDVVHRDIKPANLLLDREGTLWITDFGLAKSIDADNLTQAGDFVGTLRYMAPERLEGGGDHRADIYGLGLTLYELLCFMPAFQAENRAKLVEQVVAANPTSPRKYNPSIPRDLETIVLKAMQREPAMRYQSALELAEDLRRFQEDRPIKARRASSSEQTIRWCRRNPAVASLLAGILLVFAVGAGTASFFAVEARDRANDAENERRKAIAREKDADLARDAAQQQVVKLDVVTATQEADRKDYDKALHWVARAWKDDLARMQAQQTLESDDEDDHRLRVGAAIEKVPELLGFCLHDKPVLFADCDPTGERVVSLVGDEFARVWNSGQAELAYAPLKHDGQVTSAAYSSDGKRIVTGSLDGAASVWDAATGKLLHSIDLRTPVARIAIHPDCKTVAVAAGESVCFWSVESGEAIGEPIAVGGVLQYVAYSPDGSHLVTVAVSSPLPRAARVWDAQSRKALSETLPFPELKSGYDYIDRQRWPSFSNDGQNLLTFDTDALHLWNSHGTEIEHIPLKPKGSNDTVALISPDGNSVVYHPADPASIFCIDLKSGKRVAAWPTARRGSGMTISSDGTWIALAIAGNIQMYDGSLKDSYQLVLHHQDNITSIRFTHDSKKLLVASSDGTVRIWQVPGLVKSTPYKYDCGRADRVSEPNTSYSADGKWRTRVDFESGECRIGRVGAQGMLLPRVLPTNVKLGGLPQLTQDAQYLVSWNQSENKNGTVVESWRLESDQLTPISTVIPGGEVCKFRFSPDGKRLAGAIRVDDRPQRTSYFDEVRVWEFPSLKLVAEPLVLGDINVTRTLIFNRDGTMVAALKRGFNRGKALPCWDITDRGRILPVYTSGWVDSIDFGQNDDRLLVSESDRTLLQIDPRTGKRIGPIIPYSSTSGVSPAAFSPDQRRIAIATIIINGKDIERRIEIYSANSGELLATHLLQEPRPSGLPEVWFSSDGQRVISHAHQLNLEQWYLPRYRGSAANLLPLVCLLTGKLPNPDGGFISLETDEMLKNGEQYRNAFRDWRKSMIFEEKVPQTTPDAFKTARVANNDAWKLLTGAKEKRDSVKALVLAQKAVQRYSSEPTFWNTLGVAFYRNNRFEEAIVQLERSLAAKGKGSGVYDQFFLAMCHAKQMDRVKSKEYFDRAVKWTELPPRELSQTEIDLLKEIREEAEQILNSQDK